ncbi:lamin tail domain-containing protein [Candidatus Roizmanbacteria bacterium]|nr:lamin tail domain-containing protein [Candidatus Roizmanbacteria bacterium]
MRHVFCLITGVLLLFLSLVSAVEAADIFINEFIIEPSQSVELYNNSSESADLAGWYLDDSGGTTYFTIPAGTVLLPNACTVFSSDFNLNKTTTDTIRLFDATAPPTSTSAKLIDSFSYKSSPGDDISFFRLPDASPTWATGAASLGLLNTTKISCLLSPTPTPPLPTLTPTQTSTPVPPTPTSIPTPTPVSYNNIYLSEVMTDPAKGEKEWVELYNGNDFNVSLLNWYLDDTENSGSTPRLFSLDIPAYGYAVFDLSSSIFNNSADTVRLLDFTKAEKDSFEYLFSDPGKTLSRLDFTTDVFCLTTPTRNQPNAACSISPTIPPVANAASHLTIPSPFLPASLPSADSPPEVLGLASDYSSTVSPEHLNSTAPLIRGLSFASNGYSLLTIASVLLRMKKKTTYGKSDTVFATAVRPKTGK